MAFSMFSNHSSPIAIDFGSSNVKLLQTGGGAQPTLVAAAEITLPDSVRMEPLARIEYCAEELPKVLKEGGFRGKKVICAIPSPQTHIQHMQLMGSAGVPIADQMKTQLQTKLGVAPSAVVVRPVEVCPVHREGQALIETICFAIARDTVMRHVELLRRLKLETLGVHVDAIALVRAFDHVNRREDNAAISTLHVDLGWGGSRAVIAHGPDIVFAREIPVGGHLFDKHLASSLNCDVVTARRHRLSLEDVEPTRRPARRKGSGAEGMAILNSASAGHAADSHGKRGLFGRRSSEGSQEATAVAERSRGADPDPFEHQVLPGDGPGLPDGVSLDEPLDMLADDLKMCLRYHRGLFPGRSIDRVVFLGGEARQQWLCRQLVKALRLPAQLGDPLLRLAIDGHPSTPGLDLDLPQPGWAVACGLATGLIDL